MMLDQGALRPVGFASEGEGENGRPAVMLLLYECREWQGSPTGREGQQFGWFDVSETNAMPMPSLDRELIEKLC